MTITTMQLAYVGLAFLTGGGYFALRSWVRFEARKMIGVDAETSKLDKDFQDKNSDISKLNKRCDEIEKKVNSTQGYISVDVENRNLERKIKRVDEDSKIRSANLLSNTDSRVENIYSRLQNLETYYKREELSLEKKKEPHIQTMTTDSDGTKRWKNKEGLLHRTDGPAVERPNGDKSWCQNGKLHRTDGPAIEWASGAKYWCQHGQFHRTDGPAIEYSGGAKSWYLEGKEVTEDEVCNNVTMTVDSDGTKLWKNKEGQLHRTDGPAVEYVSGTKEWYLEGKKVTEDEVCNNVTMTVDSDGTKRWKNKEGQLHRTDGPAIEYANGTKYWYQNNELHRTDGPAVEWADGTKYWYQHGQFHRTDGPAIEWANGTKEWYQNDKRHRTDGPAVELADDTKKWYQNGKLHRTDGPAVEYTDGTKEWFQNGKLHRTDGPALEYAGGDKSGIRMINSIELMDLL